MSNFTKDRFLPGALAAILLFSVLWWLFGAAVGLFLVWIGVDILSRWAMGCTSLRSSGDNTMRA